MIQNLSIGKKAPEIVNTVVEIPKGSNIKYEFDEELNVIKLDRVLYSPMFYPVDYGFIPGTRADDGDHLDMLVLTDAPVFSGCLVDVRPIGVLMMTDDKGADEKILGVPVKDPRFNHIETLEQVSPHVLKEIVHFFETYKHLENKSVTIDGWKDKNTAIELINRYAAVWNAEQSSK